MLDETNLAHRAAAVPTGASGSRGGGRRRARSGGRRTGRRTARSSARRPASVSRLPMSPMCWLIHASRPEARQNVFFNSPPTASVGGATNGSRTGRGAYPRERLIGTLDVGVDADDGVVTRHVDRPVVRQPGVGDAPQPLTGIVIVVTDRLVAQVPTRHHEHVGNWRIATRHLPEQQMVERRVRQHHTDERVARGNGVGDRRVVATGQQARSVAEGWRAGAPRRARCTPVDGRRRDRAP